MEDTDVVAQDTLNFFWDKSALKHQPTVSIDGALISQFRQKISKHVIGFAFHAVIRAGMALVQ